MGQAFPQAPQFAASLLRSTSQPSTCLLPLQSAWRIAQTPLQTPAAQVTAATLLFEQAMPQPPQFWGSTSTWVWQPPAHLPLQSTKPALQAQVQAPFTQAVVPLGFAQVVPQAPQLPTSEVRLASQPSRGSLLQSPQPLAQEPTAQAPLVQAGVALGVMQVLPQAPQSMALVCRLVSQPSRGSLLQSPNPIEQALI